MRKGNMAEKDRRNPIAELMNRYVWIWFRIRGIDRIANLEISRWTTMFAAVASTMLGMSYGLLIGYTVGQRTIDSWVLVALIVLLVCTHVHLFYITPKLIDRVTKAVTSECDAAVIKVISEEFPSEVSEVTSIPPEPPPTLLTPLQQNNSSQKRS